MKIGFIGCGNMGGALARAVCKNLDTKVYISDRDSAKVKSFAEANNAEVSSNSDLASSSDFIFLGVKPNVIESVIKEISPVLTMRPETVIVSMAAGVSLEKISAFIGKDHPVIRIMPNTPASLGKGMILWCRNESVTDEQASSFERILSPAGRLDMIDEKLIDAASAVSGCGPAFVYMFIEALADGAVECGLPRDKAMIYAAETLSGAAAMVLETKKHPGLLKDEVCSPGGSTIEGVHALESGAFRSTVADAVVAAFEKTKALGK